MKAFSPFQDLRCPFCHSGESRYVGRNSPLSHVRICDSCKLIFRAPKQDMGFNEYFYQKAYAESHHGAATDLPKDEDMARLKDTHFEGYAKDFSPYISLLQGLNVRSVLDYGCAWGYGVYQFSQSGMKAIGIDVAQDRVEFGNRHFGDVLFYDPEMIRARGIKVDSIFSRQVLEHIPSPSIAFDLFGKILNPGGTLLLEVPNCGGRKAKEMGLKWKPFSSLVHPLSYTSEFFLEAFREKATTIHFFESPFDPEVELERFLRAPNHLSPEGSDLCVLVQF